MARKSNRNAILDAAERIVNRDGLANTTVEAVAVEAGVSKGGLFYHFPSKKEMLLQLIERHVERYKETRDSLLAEMPDHPASFIKASLLASITMPVRQGVANTPNLMALFEEPELRDKIRTLKRDLFGFLMASAPNPHRVAAAMLAADGLWINGMFGQQIFPQEFKDKVIFEILSIVDEADHPVEYEVKGTSKNH